MSETKALDLVTKRHSPFCNCAANPSAGTVCSCFTDEAAAELKNMKDNEEWSSDKIVELAETVAQLRAELAKLKERCFSAEVDYNKVNLENSELRAELDEAIRVIAELTHPLDYDTQFAHAAAFLEAHPEETK
jgi:regulator of replication initiation timing